MNTAEGNRQGQYKLLFDVRRSVRYHIKRRQFLDHLGKFFKIFTTIGGLGTITTILAKAGEGWTFFYGTLVGVFSIIDLVIGTDESARLHGEHEDYWTNGSIWWRCHFGMEGRKLRNN